MARLINCATLTAKRCFVVLVVLGLGCPVAEAVEGGTGNYLLSSRDLMAGYVPPAGNYLLNDFIYLSSAAPVLSIGGAIVTAPDIDAAVYKFSGTHVAEGEFLGGSLAVNVNLPFANAQMTADTLFQNSPLNLTDSQIGMGDLTVTTMVGWHHGNLHTSAALSFYFPTGEYSTAQIKPRDGIYDVLSIGKNKFAVDPSLSMTYLDPSNGHELSGSLGVTINARNRATDYLTAPELHFELTAGQHLANGLVFGATGYIYQQLDNDSGSGASNFQRAIGAKSLQARVMGAGPVLQYNGALGDVPFSAKAKFVQEFGAKRRLESQIYWLTLGTSF